MGNTCNSCKMRWLCAPYGGRCRRKRRYIGDVLESIKMIATQKVDELQDYAEKMVMEVWRRMEDGKAG